MKFIALQTKGKTYLVTNSLSYSGVKHFAKKNHILVNMVMTHESRKKIKLFIGYYKMILSSLVSAFIPIPSLIHDNHFIHWISYF